MATPGSSVSLSRIVDVAIPIVTFIAGYSLSVFDKFRENRRNVKNMETILFTELGNNYKLLNPFVPSNRSFHPNLVQILAGQVGMFRLEFMKPT